LTPEIEQKERPHSFSGGLSSADLRRLQQAGDHVSDTNDIQGQQWASAQHYNGAVDMPHPSEQLSYPTISAVQRPQAQRYTVAAQRDDLQVDYNAQTRAFNSAPLGGQQNFAGRPANIVPAAYRQAPRFPQPNVVSPTQMGYPTNLSIGSSQQLYDLMLPGHHDHPAVARVQQQHNVYPRGHHHSNSDPSVMRDASVLSLLNNNVAGFPPGMFQAQMTPAAMMYANQFYGQDAYNRPDMLNAQTMARLQSQFTGTYGIVPPQGMVLDSGLPSPGSVGSNGPSANNRKLGLYKTELCRSWEEKGSCRYGAKCQFAHGEDELRNVSRHPKVSVRICVSKKQTNSDSFSTRPRFAG
jgi:tristetraprolin